MQVKLLSEAEAISWASQFVEAQTIKRVSNHPWAKTYCLSAPDKDVFLKVTLGGENRGKHIQHLSDRAGDTLPELLQQDTDRGLFLYADMNAEVLSGTLDPETKLRVLKLYGEVQETCAELVNVQEALPHVSCAGALDRFVSLLNLALSGRPKQDAPGNPFSYFSERSLGGYATVFQAVAPELRQRFLNVDALPGTINHGDLRLKNIARTNTGDLKIFDWDDAIWAPPGFSLHAQFHGAHKVNLALDADSVFEKSSVVRDAEALNSYIQAVSASPAFQDIDLRDCLRYSSVAGVFHYVSAFAPYKIESSSSRKSIKRNVRRRISDLFDLFSYWAGKDREFAEVLSKAYQASGRKDRAKDIQAKWVQPAQIGTSGVHHAHRPDFDVTVTGTEHVTGTWEQDRLTRLIDTYQSNGTLVLRDVFDPNKLKECHAKFEADLEDYQADVRDGGALRVGDKRFMISPGLDGPFASAEVLANRFVLPVLTGLLSRGLVLGSFTSVASAPGASEQKIHRDNPLLFPEQPDLDLPSFSIALIIPLVPLTVETGTTRLWPGSHRLHYNSYDSVPFTDPLVGVGSCYLMDSRLFHQGLANRSDRIRPILSLVYQRPWYTDYKNFKNQDRIKFGSTSIKSFDPDVRKLVEWAL